MAVTRGIPHKSDVPEDQGRPEDPLSVSPQPEHPFDDGGDDDENDVQKATAMGTIIRLSIRLCLVALAMALMKM